MIAEDDKHWERLLQNRYPMSASIVSKRFRWSFYQMAEYLKQNRKSKPPRNCDTGELDVRYAKVLICGAGGVGCTAIVKHFIEGNFMDEYDPTIEDSYRTHIKSDYYNVMMEILDVAGQAEYRALRDHWFRTAEYYILVFDLTSRATFVDDLSDWYDHILRVREDRKGMIVVGNKADLTNFIQVTPNEGHLWAKERGLSYMEISATDRKSCTNVFMRVLDLDDTILQTPELWQTLAAGKSIVEKNKKCNIM